MDRRGLGGLTLVAGVALALCPTCPTGCLAAASGDREFLKAEADDVAAPAEADEQGESGDQAAQGQNVFAPPDRATLRLLTQARQLVDQDRYVEAVRCLGALFDSPQDYFFRPDKDDPTPRSLKSEAQRLLGQMSRRGRELYELQYGARARRMLAEAAAAGDGTGLADVSRRFFHTQAGYEATLLLGLHHLDHGRPLAGALALERLRETSPEADQFEPALSLAMAICWTRAGMREKAEQTLSMLKERHPKAAVQIAGEQVLLFAEKDDALEWLSGLAGPQTTSDVDEPGQWAMFRGNPARNASVAGDGPLLSTRWRVPTSDRPDVEALIEQVRDADREWDRSALPSLHPLAVDDVVLMRTARNLLAVDFVTGKRIWETPVDNPFEILLDPLLDSLHRRTPQLEYAVRLRMWADTTYGTLSSDGQCVFTIEDLGLEIGRIRLHAVLTSKQGSDDPVGPKPYNRLAAYDVRTGKLKWHVGGSPDEFGLPQAGAFFLGPPLPLMDRLYVIAETMGEIRLMVLQSDTGELIWSQQLAGTDQLLVKDPLRRLAGVSPSYADGVLVCPTSNRSIVALQLATRSLLWGYTYPQADGGRAQQAVFFGQRSVMDPDPVGRWTDSSVVVADGRVLVTPVESEYLHCLNLVDGSLLWKEPRNDDVYLACVHQGKAVVVGRRRVRALDLDKTRDKTAEEQPPKTPGQTPANSLVTPQLEKDDYERPAPAWDGRTVEFPAGSTPTGMGFLSGDVYYVPLSTAEVIAVDVTAGRPVRVCKSRQGAVPGNLICHKGKILSQDATGLEAFDQLEALREQVDQRLLAASDDAEALALRGEILWDEGKLAEAIDCLRRSQKIQPDPHTRQLLREALFDGLRVQFDVQRHDVEEIERLIDGPGDRATYLRLMAVGLAGAGEYRSALAHYVKLIELDSHDRGMERVDESLSMRRDRWIQVQLAALGEAAPTEVQAEIDQIAEARFKDAVAAGSPEAVARFLDYFRVQPIAEEAHRGLVRQYRESGEWLAAELLLKREERSASAEARARAVAELAHMLRRSGRWEDAAVCYNRLEQELADVVCLDGKTGRELVESLPPDDPIRGRMQSASPWPTGKVLVTKSTPKRTPPATYNEAPLPFEGDRAPFFSDVSVELHQTPLPKLVARDSLGKEQWMLPLTELASQGDFFVNRGLMRLSACGHLLVLASGASALAIDPLGTADNPLPRLLWSHDLDEPGTDPSGRERLRVQLANLAGGIPRIHLARYAQDPINVPRTVSEHVLCFKRFRSCIAVDPWTGQTLWVRENIPRDAEVFGDGEYVFVVPSGETTATVLRALDGTTLGQREVPLERERTFGRHVLVWREGEGRRVLEMVDPWDNRTLWPPQQFAAGATLRYVAHEAAGVYEPDGRFVLVNLGDGRPIIDANLEPQRDLSEVFVLRSADQYVLITYDRTSQLGQGRQTHAIHGGPRARIARGRVHAFDREGKKLWPSPVTVEDQWLPLSQPSGLPVLTFACILQERRANAQPKSKTSVLCIDKRTGREVYRERLPHGTNSLRLVGNPDNKTVELRLQHDTITLTFTDQPLAPESEEGTSSEEASSGPRWKGSATARAVWNAIRTAIIETASGSNEP